MLLPDDHLANGCIRRLLQSLPKFNVTTPIPYNKNELVTLHKENLNIVTNYLCKHNLPIPDVFSFTCQHPNRCSMFTAEMCETLSSNHPFCRLKGLLNTFKLTIVPADKTKTIIILPEDTLLKELSIHLQDSNTYQILTAEEYDNFYNIQYQSVYDAMLFYKDSSLLPSNPSRRYIYFLPKIHKEYTEWRSSTHPKMRPIICDTGSVTYKLSQRLLPTLQHIERHISTTVTSSLAVVYNIYKSIIIPTSETQLATIDVESLFTKIPQHILLDILNKHLSILLTNNSEKEKFINYLQAIIRFNTFQINKSYCLQKIGLAMGCPLSGTLANIYLGHMERIICKIPKIILYNRYMDDILLVCNFDMEEMEKFLLSLRSAFGLNIVASHNKHSVNFLDFSLSISLAKGQFVISPYSKKTPIYPIPSTVTKRGLAADKNIITSQLLRTYRICTDDRQFTQSVNKYLPYLQHSQYHRRLRRHVFKFLLPIKISSHKWTTTIPLCSQCRHNILINNIKVQKIMVIDSTQYIAIRQPLNCHSPNVYIVMQYPSEKFLLRHISSLHIFLQSANIKNINIMPFGQMNDGKLQSLLTKYKSIEFVNKMEIINRKRIYSCRIHHIFKKSLNMYGIFTTRKRKKSIGTFFNKYKQVSRKCQ